jgi:hypothetical protein
MVVSGDRHGAIGPIDDRAIADRPIGLQADRRLADCHLPVDFFERLGDVLAATLVRRRGELAGEIRARQTERLQMSRLDRIGPGVLPPPRPRFSDLVHPLLNPRLRVDQSLTRITHIVEPPLNYFSGVGTSGYRLLIIGYRDLSDRAIALSMFAPSMRARSNIRVYCAIHSPLATSNP